MNGDYREITNRFPLTTDSLAEFVGFRAVLSVGEGGAIIEPTPIRLTIVKSDEGNGAGYELTWPSQTGVSYVIETVESLTESWQAVDGGHLVGDGATLSWPVDGSHPAGFFRIRLE